MLLQNIQHLPPVLGLSHYFEILFQGKQAAKSVAEDRMVVRDHDPDLGLRCSPQPGRSICARFILSHTLSVRNCRVPKLPSQMMSQYYKSEERRVGKEWRSR